MADLFSTSASSAPDSYDASAIEVLEGLEPVRRRPGMYIGGTDERALHHLAAEVIDNSMDEAVAGVATRIEVTLEPGNRLTVNDNGRGIPVDPHSRLPGKSALEVIMTTLHSGGKFEGKAYSTSGGLHGVGVSVVNALSSETVVEVARDRMLYRQAFSRGVATSPLETVGPTPNRRGTTTVFVPDPEIFGADAHFSPERIYKLARSKAYLFAGVEIRWRCDPSLASPPNDPNGVPETAVFQFAHGLADHPAEQFGHRLTSLEAARFVEAAVRDHFDHYLADNMDRGRALLGSIVERAEDRLRRRAEREVQRKTATSARKLRLPGKLTDCSSDDPEGTELFIVEGDSAGGSAKQARNRKTQAILPIRGKILNVASATADKIRANSEIADLGLALGCGMRDKWNEDALRYERIIIMTDADVDGAHIATLLMTFFFQEMPELVRRGHLFLAQPPLYRLTVGAKTLYARDDAHRAELEATEFKGKKVEVSRFKGLGEMNPNQLKETTMDPATRSMLKVTLPSAYEDRQPIKDLVERLMGRDPAHRFEFIQNSAASVDEGAIDA